MRIVCVGRLSPEKGHLGLLQAFAELRDAGVDAELRIVGEGDARPAIVSGIQARQLAPWVHLTGMLPEPAVLHEIAAADLLVSASFMEGLPVVLIEALALCVPVIAPRVAGVPELVEDEVCGLLFHPSDWAELAQQMIRLARDPDLRRQLADNGQRRVQTTFDIDIAVVPLAERFQALTPSPTRSRFTPT